MISELVIFALPPAMSREQVIEGMREVAPRWRDEPELIRKTFLYDAAAGQAGALYSWRSLVAAQNAHDDRWRAAIRAKYGSEPSVHYFETPLIVDNALGAVVAASATPEDRAALSAGSVPSKGSPRRGAPGASGPGA